MSVEEIASAFMKRDSLIDKIQDQINSFKIQNIKWLTSPVDCIADVLASDGEELSLKD